MHAQGHARYAHQCGEENCRHQDEHPRFRLFLHPHQQHSDGEIDNRAIGGVAAWKTGRAFDHHRVDQCGTRTAELHFQQGHQYRPADRRACGQKGDAIGALGERKGGCAKNDQRQEGRTAKAGKIEHRLFKPYRSHHLPDRIGMAESEQNDLVKMAKLALADFGPEPQQQGRRARYQPDNRHQSRR